MRAWMSFTRGLIGVLGSVSARFSLSERDRLMSLIRGLEQALVESRREKRRLSDTADHQVVESSKRQIGYRAAIVCGVVALMRTASLTRSVRYRAPKAAANAS
jgi:hypothetical protein